MSLLERLEKVSDTFILFGHWGCCGATGSRGAETRALLK